jgi:predicted PurR-regulated permease PerM
LQVDEHARALEEQWIDSIDNAGTATLSQSSSSSSAILQGVLVGFFFPFLPFFFMRSQKLAVFWEDGSEQETSPTVIFS